MKLRSWLPLITGLVIGISAAVAEAFLRIQPPAGYGVCLLGHPASLAKWVTNSVFGTNLGITPVFVIFPSLLVIGILIGAYVASYRNKELKLRPGPVTNRYKAVMFGFLVVNFGLLWGSCPIRTGLLVSYGWVMAVIALVTIIFGVILACKYIRFKVGR